MNSLKYAGLTLLLGVGVLTNARAETFRTDINPALLYYQAFLLAPHDSADLDYLYTNNWQGKKLPERFGKIVDYYHTDLRLWHQAAKQTVPCDWGIDLSQGPETLLPELAYCKRVAQAERLHAMWELQQGNETEAVEDLVAALAAGWNSAQDGTLIAILVQIAIENIVCATVAENFQCFSPAGLQTLAAGLAAAPERRTLGACLKAEKLISGRWLNTQIQDLRKAHPDDETAVMQGLQRKITDLQPEGDTNYWEKITNAAQGTSDGLVKMTQVSEVLSARLETLLTLPHGPFEEQFQSFAEDVRKSGDFLFGDTLDAWSNSRRKEFTIQVELAMVRAAIEYKLRGEAGLAGVPDPLGNGPFTFQRFVFQGEDRGFQLTSTYVATKGPVKMIFIEKDGPAITVLGPRAGQAVTP